MSTGRFILVCLFEILLIRSGYSQSYTLFKDGNSSYSIIVSEEASASEKFAADELQYFINEIGLVKLPIKTTQIVNSNSPKIIIGYTTANECSINITKPEDEDESCSYFSKDGNIIIYGGANIGTLYGVYFFLEKELDCRWLTANVNSIPKRNEWSFNTLYCHREPAFKYRHLYCKGAFDKLWSLRNQNNVQPEQYESKYGNIPISQYTFWAVHTFFRFVPPSKYYSNHPEYYSLIDGKREAKQLCLTNRRVKELCEDELRKVILTYPGFCVYDVSQNDDIAYCQCDNCKKIRKKTGSESGLIIWFVNQVANDLKKDFPDKFIGTLAYQYSQKPPQSIIPDDNVVIRLSIINSCLIHGYDHCPKNQSTASDIKEWSEITENLFIWDYISTTRMFYAPIPNFNAIKERLEYYQKNGVKGVFLEGNASINNGEFSDLRNYVITKLLWNPKADLDSLVDDFINRYYGNVASYMKEYYLLTQSRANVENNHLFFVMDHKNKVYSENYLNSAYLILTRAEAEADNPIIQNRVKAEIMSIAYLLCKTNPKEAVKNGAYAFVKEWSQTNKIEYFATYGEHVDTKVFFEQMEKYVK